MFTRHGKHANQVGVIMDAAKRRTTISTFQQQQQQENVISHIPMSTQRKQRPTDMLGASNNRTASQTQILGGRFSMAVPQRVVSRQSMAPFQSSSQEQLYHSQQSSQAYTQSNGLAVPATIGRQSYLYKSHNVPLGQSGARGDAGYLRSSSLQSSNSQAQGYAPPR